MFNSGASSFHIIHLPKNAKYSEVHMYVDDAVVFFSSGNPNTIKNRLNSDLDVINIWFSLNKLSLNKSNTKFMVYSTNSLDKRFSDIALNIGGETKQSKISLLFWRSF